MSYDKAREEVDKLNKKAYEKVKEIFKAHGLCSYRRVGLQRTLRNALVEAAVSGKIRTEGKETFRHTS